VQEIASDQSQPVAMQVAGGKLYFANRGTVDDEGNFKDDANVSVVSVDGGEIAELARDDRPIRKLAVGDDEVYWSSGDDEQRIMRVVKTGGDPSVVRDGVHVLDALTLADGKLYWIDQRDGERESRLMSAAVSGDAPPEVLWTRADVSTGPLLSDGEVYWIEQQSTFWSAASDGSGETRRATSADSNESLCVMTRDGDRIDVGWSSGKSQGVSVFDTNDASFERVRNVSEDRGVPVAIVADDDNFYVVSHDSKQRRMNLIRTPRSESEAPELLMLWTTTGADPDDALAVDDVAVYVTTPSFIANHGRAILRIRKRW
jgi:hypothetical protein